MKLNRCFILFAVSALLAFTASAQSFVGELRGLVQDPGGAVIGGANITLRNDATGITRTTVSNGGGEYVLSQLEPATYTIVAEAAGFKRLEHREVNIGTQQKIQLDLKMELGQVSESVSVVAEVPLIESSTASNGQVLTTQQIADLPNLGRNTFLLSKLNNNVIPSGPPQWNRFQDQIGSSNLSIGGGPIRGNNYLIDGVPITSSQNLAIIIPSEEGVQEMKLQENTYDATMGRTGGGVFNTVIKSGTNTLHGDVMGYLRTTDFTANTFFANAARVTRPSEQWENWISSLGGPVVIPKLYDGRNKTFFFIANEGYIENQPASGSYAVPTAAERMGNFSQAGVTIFDPLQSAACATGQCPSGATVVRTAFPGNIIPASRINPVGQGILSYLPMPNGNAARIDQLNFQGTDTLANHANELVTKVEEVPTQWLRLNASFLWYKSFEPGGNTLTTTPGSGSYLLTRHVDATAVNAIMTVNPTTVITARYGFNRFPNTYRYVSQGFDPTSLGLPASYLTDNIQHEFPGVTMSEGSTSFGGGTPSDIVYWSKNASFSVSKFTGRHNITAGFDYRLIHTDGSSHTVSDGAFTFNGIFSQQYNGGPNNSTGSDYADLLLGFPSAGTITTYTKQFFFVKYYSGFVQDDIRVSNKLTLNLGLRYEYETGEGESNNNMLVAFNQTAVNPISKQLPAGSGVTPYGVPMYAGQNGNPTACCNALANKFGPRAGFAYRLNDKTTLRGGYGIFYAPVYFSSDSTYAPGFSQTTTYLASTDGNATPANNLKNPWSNGILQPVGNTLGPLVALGSTFSYPDQKRTQGRVQQFSFDVQRELPGNVAVEVGYIGSRSANLQAGSTGSGLLPVNQLSPQYMSMGSALTKSAANPFYGLPNVGGVLGGKTVTQAQLLLPYPQYSTILDSFNPAVAQYDSLVMKAQKRFTKGLTFLSTFTWSKNYDNEFGSAGSNYFNDTAPPAYPQNVYNLAAEWALASSDVPWRFTSGYTYELPFGKGKPFLANNRFLDYAVGGWAVNGITIISSGFPLFIFQPNGNSGIGAQVQRPNATGLDPTGSGAPESRMNNYVNPAAFSSAPQYTFGNTARSIPNLGPGMANWDVSIFKKFSIMERVHAEFRAEALNAFNTPDFTNPNTNFTPNNPNFGHIYKQMNLARELQLGIRFFF